MLDQGCCGPADDPNKVQKELSRVNELTRESMQNCGEVVYCYFVTFNVIVLTIGRPLLGVMVMMMVHEPLFSA